MNAIEKKRWDRFRNIHTKLHKKPIDDPDSFQEYYYPSFYYEKHSTGIGTCYIVVCNDCNERQDIIDYGCW